MLVIPQQVGVRPLPQPGGPVEPREVSASTNLEHDDRLAHLPAGGEPSTSTPVTPPHGMQPAKKPSSRAGTFARSHTMFNPSTSEGMGTHLRAAASSRESSPLSSAPSSARSSSRLRAARASVTDTPTSTNPSTAGSTSTAQTTPRGKREVFVDIVERHRGKGKSKEPMLDDPAAIPYEIPDISIPAFARMTKNAQRDLGRVWEAVAGARRIAVVTGAGISVSSPANIPDFRSTAGLFRKLKEKHPNAGLSSGKDLFDANLFKSQSTSALFYSMIAELKAMADAAQPTSFHHLLKRLDLEGRLQRVYTQNIDGLEEKAGLTFGLGETSDSRAALRALGKRKREALNGSGLLRKGTMARSKSDSAVLLSRADSNSFEKPMFPRSIPLHGSLSTMTCQVCGHKVYLSLVSESEENLPRAMRALSHDAWDQATAAMDLLSQGEPVHCKQCEAHAEVRSVAGLRSRGVGLMKVDVVLYNGQNEGAERVGDCLERDILGLRDPNEAKVPENDRERSIRERKERKTQAQASQVSGLKPIMEASSAEDAFASAFGDEDGASDDPFGGSSVPPTVIEEKPRRQQRLKPLPPDLLIVAGTSLKVPGTKRIVREFAKACQAQDHCICESSDEEGDEDDASTSRKSHPRRSRSSTPKATASKTKKSAIKDEEDAEQDESDDDDDINAPIRTILLNYDFPLPHPSWEDVFDVWVQGDVQQAALGLWEASVFPAGEASKGYSMQNDCDPTIKDDKLSWAPYFELVEEERRAANRAASRKPSNSQKSLLTPLSSQSKTVKGQESSAKAAIKADKPTAKASPKKKALSKEYVSSSPKKAAIPAKKVTGGVQAARNLPVSPAKKRTKATTSAAASKAKSLSVRPPKATALTKHVTTSKKASGAIGAPAAVTAAAATAGKRGKANA